MLRGDYEDLRNNTNSLIRERYNKKCGICIGKLKKGVGCFDTNPDDCEFQWPSYVVPGNMCCKPTGKESDATTDKSNEGITIHEPEVDEQSNFMNKN